MPAVPAARPCSFTLQKAQIAADARVLGPLDGRMPEKLPERLLGKLLPIKCLEIQDRRNGGESGLVSRMGKTVPRTDILTRITAKQPVIELAFHLFRDQEIL